MNTEQQAQQLELAAQILRTGHPWEHYPYFASAAFRWLSGAGKCPLQRLANGNKIRLVLAVPPDGRPLHNPDNLTAEQVGAGWRLTLKGEEPHDQAKMWMPGSKTWQKRGIKTDPYRGTYTYRVPLSAPWPEAPKPDPYAELKAAHAAGKVIEVYQITRDVWEECPKPVWSAPIEYYRIVEPDPYAELKAAHAAGKVIQFEDDGGIWRDIENPNWRLPAYDYRIKPEPAFQLPPPPPGMRWHREDGWQECDLPQGWRPLVYCEQPHEGDEQKIGSDWMLQTSIGLTIRPTEAQQLQRTRRPLTFEHAGKTWTWHRPGDPMPCDGETRVRILTIKDVKQGYVDEINRAVNCNWSDDAGDGNILGWRYAEKKTVPLGPEDVPPGSVFRHDTQKQGTWQMVTSSAGHDYVMIDNEKIRFTAMQRWKINRSIPLTGKWDASAWEPCHKQI